MLAANRLQVTRTVVREYTWDGKRFETLSKEELLEALKALAEDRERQPIGIAQFAAPPRQCGYTVVADAFAASRPAGCRGI